MFVIRARHLIRVENASRRLASTVAEAVNDLTGKFTASKIPEPASSANHLVASVLKLNNLEQIKAKAQNQLTQEQETILSTLVHCRLSRMPVQYIVKEWDFLDLTLKVRPPVFIPRPETERLVKMVLQHVETMEGKIKLLEIGCGSGAISLALLKYLSEEKLAQVVSVDQSQEACLLTMENAMQFNLQDRLLVKKAKLKEDGSFDVDVSNDNYDIIVSNPPYVLRKDLSKLEPEIALYEDLRALDGGKDGMRTILALLKMSSKGFLSSSEKSRVFLEVDPCHKHLLPEQMKYEKEITLQLESVEQDFAGLDRYMSFKFK